MGTAFCGYHRQACFGHLAASTVVAELVNFNPICCGHILCAAATTTAIAITQRGCSDHQFHKIFQSQ
jgi:hypothetical protein